MLKKTCETEVHMLCGVTDTIGDVTSQLKAKDTLYDNGVYIPFHAVAYAAVSCNTEEVQITDSVCGGG